MNEIGDRIGLRYQQGLLDYLHDPGEAQLNRAYETGREALIGGLGILELLALHHQTLQAVPALAQPPRRGEDRDPSGAADCFLAECLSPFELSYRATREAALSLQRLNETLENEIKRIAHALHNEAGQLLASVHIALADLGSALPGPARERVVEITRMLKDSEDALRDLSHELRPMVLEDLGLLPALRFLADRASRRSKLAITVRGRAQGRMPAAVESAVYRAAQEGLNNVVKHARARSVRIRLRCGSRAVSCLVQDDGVGLANPARREESAGLGLIGIRERLGSLGGSFRIASRAERGTRLLVVVPLET